MRRVWARLRLLWIVLWTPRYSYVTAIIELSRVSGWGTSLRHEIDPGSTLRADIQVRRSLAGGSPCLYVSHFELGS